LNFACPFPTSQMARFFVFGRHGAWPTWLLGGGLWLCGRRFRLPIVRNHERLLPRSLIRVRVSDRFYQTRREWRRSASDLPRLRRTRPDCLERSGVFEGPSITVSATEPTSVATTGISQASASMIDTGDASLCEQRVDRSRPVSIRGVSCRISSR
jgi:hypothetical protein